VITKLTFYLLEISSASSRQRFRIRHFYNFQGSRSVSANLLGFVLLNKIFFNH